MSLYGPKILKIVTGEWRGFHMDSKTNGKTENKQLVPVTSFIRTAEIKIIKKYVQGI